MSSNQKRPNNPPSKNINDREILSQILELEQKKLASKADETRLEEKRIEVHERLASRGLEIQGKLALDKAKNQRGDMYTKTLCIALPCLFLIGLLIFAAKYVSPEYSGNLMKWIGYILGLVFSFIAGRLSTGYKKQKQEVVEPDVEEVE